MKRREFITLLGLTTFAPCVRAADDRLYRLGVVVQAERSRYVTLFAELRRLGYVEGTNLLVVDPQGFETSTDRLGAVATEVAKAAPDAIYCGGDAACRAAQRATRTVPVVALTDEISPSLN